MSIDLQSIKNRFNIIGNSAGLNHALSVAVQVANTDLSVLITGESGVGKEIFSTIIHALSSRKHNPFIAVNCGAIPEGTIDSELFGHEKGAFTGAVDNRKGYFETVNGGTIFLDEIAEMPLGTQARLLRVLESGEFIRVGSSRVQKTDVRVIAASNKDLLEEAQKGKFREDLYYRLNSVPIRIPALRDRKEDVPLLFRKFVIDFSERYKTNPVNLTDDARRMLMDYPWRGNVRELKNIAEQISVLVEANPISGADLAPFLPDTGGNRLPVLASGAQGSFITESHFANEREILYKFIFDLKKDVNEIKRLFIELAANPNGAAAGSFQKVFQDHAATENAFVPFSFKEETPQAPQVVMPATTANTRADGFDQHEDVEESLSIADMEKELIIKALKKHRSRRKDAALDLGISERTLYRKLKEYDIENL